MTRDDLKRDLSAALAHLGITGPVQVERPEDSAYGDFSSNAALVHAKERGTSPRDLAEKIKNAVLKEKPDYIEKVEIAGPGFLNFFVQEASVRGDLVSLSEFLKDGGEGKKDERIHIEFISSNPTGSLHIGNGRGAFYGDALARVLSFLGADVTREFYINDSKESAQIRALGKTAHGEGEAYRSPLLDGILSKGNFEGTETDVGFAVAGKIQKYNQKFIEEELGIPFDVWFSEEKEIREKHAAAHIIGKLKEANMTRERDGAVWLSTSKYGDDEDRVLVRSDGTFTYFASDIAYHANKFARGFTTVIDIWGADHHGHVGRMQAAGKILGWTGELVIFVTQIVSLKEAGALKKMSKRKGDIVLLGDLLREVGRDALRWFYLEKSLNTHMEIDVALAKEASQKNPVYYVQYAHARIASILRNAGAAGTTGGWGVPLDEVERHLAFKLTECKEVCEAVGNDYSVHRLTDYAYKLAAEFNRFYRDAKVLGSPRQEVRLKLAALAGETIQRTLNLLGISAPEQM